MPIQHTNTHRSQQHFIRKIDAEKEKLKIDNALARLSLINRQLLYYTYCSVEKKTNVWIASELGYSVSNVETLKCVAHLNLLKHMNLVCFNAIKVRLTEIVVLRFYGG